MLCLSVWPLGVWKHPAQRSGQGAFWALLCYPLVWVQAFAIKKDCTQMVLSLPASEDGGENCPLLVMVTSAVLVPSIGKPTQALKTVQEQFTPAVPHFEWPKQP